MNDVPIPGKDDESQIFRQILGHYDAPAYIRRARAVEHSFQAILEQHRRKRDELLTFVRLHLATLEAQAGDWDVLTGLISAQACRHLQLWFDEWKPALRVPVECTTSAGAFRRTLAELRDSVARFNDRWRAVVDGIDWTAVNQVREAYNKYYVLEKECALRSIRLARAGFRRLEPLGAADLLAVLPFLEEPNW